MDSLIELALKLPAEEKIKLYHALQEDLDLEDEILSEPELSAKQWKEMNKRISDIDSGKSKMITVKEFKEKMEIKINELRGNS